MKLFRRSSAFLVTAGMLCAAVPSFASDVVSKSGADASDYIPFNPRSPIMRNVVAQDDAAIQRQALSSPAVAANVTHLQGNLRVPNPGLVMNEDYITYRALGVIDSSSSVSLVTKRVDLQCGRREDGAPDTSHASYYKYNQQLIDPETGSNGQEFSLIGAFGSVISTFPKVQDPSRTEYEFFDRASYKIIALECPTGTANFAGCVKTRPTHSLDVLTLNDQFTRKACARVWKLVAGTLAGKRSNTGGAKDTHNAYLGERAFYRNLRGTVAAFTRFEN